MPIRLPSFSLIYANYKLAAKVDTYADKRKLVCELAGITVQSSIKKVLAVAIE